MHNMIIEWIYQTLSLEGNTSMDPADDDNEQLSSSTIEIVKKNSETEAKLRMEGIW